MSVLAGSGARGEGWGETMSSLQPSQVRVRSQEDLPERTAGTGQPVSTLTKGSQGVSDDVVICGRGSSAPCPSPGPPLRTTPLPCWEEVRSCCDDNVALTPLSPALLPDTGTKWGTQLPCPEGTYSSQSGNSQVEDCLPCPPGAFCPRGTPKPVLCPRYGRLEAGGLLLKLSDHMLHTGAQCCFRHRGVLERPSGPGSLFETRHRNRKGRAKVQGPG